MELHTKIIIGLVLIALLVIIPIAIALFRKWRKGRGTGDKKKAFCVWFFKCDQNQNEAREHIFRNGHMVHEMHDINGGAAHDRLIY